jgi:hypothetical protein
MSWGENGMMLVPKAQPIGKGDINTGITSVDSGQIQGKKLYLTTGTLMFGASEDVEIGVSKRTFIWEDGYRTDIEMDSFHLKARVFNLTDYYTPQISVGVNGASIASNSFKEEKDILYNPYVVMTLPIKIVTEDYLFSISAVGEKIFSDGEGTEIIWSAGGDLIFFNTLYLMAEAQGLGQEEEEPVINVGAKVKYGWFSFGAGLFNIAKDKVQSGDVGSEENDEQYWMVHMNMEIPLLKLFGLDKKEAPKTN